MEITIIVLAILAGVLGFVGSIVPGLPGPPVSWVGLLLLYIWGSGVNAAGDLMSLQTLIIWGVVMVAVTILDYVVPMWFTKLTGGSKHAERGAMIGLIVGIFLTPIGMILGSFLGAFIAELHWGGKTEWEAFKAACGSFVGFLFGTGIKAITSVLIFWQILVYAF